MEKELWSIKERMIYPENNTRRININGVWILATPKGEPLVLRVR